MRLRKTCSASFVAKGGEPTLYLLLLSFILNVVELGRFWFSFVVLIRRISLVAILM